MFKHVHILVNEYSGGLCGQDHLIVITDYLRQQHIPYFVYKTTYTKHAYSLTRQIARIMTLRSDDLFLVIGGDGTLHEVVESLHQANFHIPVGYIPAGTGNDFSRALYRTHHPLQQIKAILSCRKTTVVPILKVNDMIALNSFGIGFDAQVTHDVNLSRIKQKLNRLKLGSLVYLIYTIKNLWHFKSFSVTIHTNTQTVTHKNCCLTTVMNNGYFGGGIHFDPSMTLTAPHFSVMVVKDVTLKAICRFLPKLFKGTHLTDQNLTRYTDDALQLRPHCPHLIQLDGETYLPDDNQEISYDIRMATQEFYII